MRSYNQFCPAARALDIVGERWGLLVVRELLHGPKRYTDLQAGLPGIGPNVLTDRLRSLEAAEVVRKRRLPPPAASTVYELTELGAGLRPVLMELFRWGLQLTDRPASDDALKASWWLPAVEAAVGRAGLPDDVDEAYEMRIADDVITIEVSQGSVAVREGPADNPSVVVKTDHETFALLGRRQVSPRDAMGTGKMVVEGDGGAAKRCASLFNDQPAGAGSTRAVL